MLNPEQLLAHTNAKHSLPSHILDTAVHYLAAHMLNAPRQGDVVSVYVPGDLLGLFHDMVKLNERIEAFGWQAKKTLVSVILTPLKTDAIPEKQHTPVETPAVPETEPSPAYSPIEEAELQPDVPTPPPTAEDDEESLLDPEEKAPPVLEEEEDETPTPKTKKTARELLVEWRDSNADISQGAMSRVVGVTPGTMSKWLSPKLKCEPNEESRRAILREFRISSRLPWR